MANAFDFADDDGDDDYTPKRGGRSGRGSEKSRVVFAILAILFGSFGIHNFYVGRSIVGIAQLGLFVISIPLCFFLIGFITIWIPQAWAVFDIITVTRDSQGRTLS